MKHLSLFLFFALFLLPSLASADTTISTNITSNQTWTTASGTYIVTTGIAINSGITLTINSGVVVKFQGTGAAITVNGTLNAQGSTSSPIYFTSYKDDTVGGDTNGDGSASTPYNGDWRYLYTPTGGATTLTHAIIRYGGASGEGQLLVYNGGTATLTQSEVASSSSYGIANATTGGIFTINYSDIHDNGATTSTTYFGVRHLGGTTTIDHSTIRNNANYGIQSEIGGAGNLYVTNNTFTNSRGGAALIYLPNNLNFVHYNNVSTGVGKGGIVIYGSPNSNQTWYGDPYLPYIVNSATGSVTFTGASTVTVGAGAVFKLEGAGAKIDVNYFSTLNADSSASTSKIYFTSIKDDTVGGDTNGDGSATSPSAGDWDTFKVTGASTLNNVVVRYGGNTAIPQSSKMVWINGGTLNLNNVEIASSSLYGLYDGSYWSTLNATSTTIHHNLYGYTYSGGTNSRIANRGNTIYANSLYGIVNLTTTSLNAEQIYWPATSTGATMNGPYSTTTNPNGHGDAVLPTYIDVEPWVSTINSNITATTTWTASSTYIIDGAVTVSSGVTLTIPAGTVVKFKDTDSRLIVSGTLVADSDASSTKIYFTSYKDDAVGGDTNGDGSATTPAAGDWNGIRVGTTGIATLRNLVIRYAGYTGASSKSLWNIGGTLTGYNITVATGTTYGIYSDGGITNILASDITAHAYGFYRADGTIFAQSNSIHGNTSYGFYNASTTNNSDARYNYWGASNGPDNPPIYWGSGDNISDHVNANSYLDQMHYLNFWEGELRKSVQSKAIDWAWYNATSTYKDAWYGGVNTWNVYGSSVSGVTIATSTAATSSADLLVLDIATSSSDYFIAGHFTDVTPHQIKFNPYHMNQIDSSGKQRAATHELGHALGLGHSYIGNIMLSYGTTTAQTSLGTQDTLDYDYLNANLW